MVSENDFYSFMMWSLCFPSSMLRVTTLKWCFSFVTSDLTTEFGFERCSNCFEDIVWFCRKSLRFFIVQKLGLQFREKDGR